MSPWIKLLSTFSVARNSREHPVTVSQAGCHKDTLTNLFVGRHLALVVGVYVAALAFTMSAIHPIATRLAPGIDCPRYWPMGVFKLKNFLSGGNVHNLAYFAMSSAVFVLVMKSRRVVLANVATMLSVCVLLVISTNLIQGPQLGLARPTYEKGGVEQYYNDALAVRSTGDFLRRFADIQHTLSAHARTHPPGATLVYYWAKQFWPSPSAISILIATAATFGTGLPLYMLLLDRIQRSRALFLTFVFLLIPSIQVYYLASLDALVAGVVLAVVLFYTRPKSFPGIIGAGGAFFAASSLTFAAVFLLPVLLGYEVLCRRNVARFTAVLAIATGAHLVVYYTSGFNYIAGVSTASRLENPHGFRLLCDTGSYILTRFENIAEILVFLGPFMILLGSRGLRVLRSQKEFRDWYVLMLLAVGTLLAMFATGAFRTGETGRTCLFIFPFLFLPVAAYLGNRQLNERDEILLPLLLFAHTVIFQAMGRYYW